MKANNRLARDYVINHAPDAVRALEGLPAEDAAALLVSLDTGVAADLFTIMLPHAAAACLARMDEAAAAEILGRAKHPAAARALKAATPHLAGRLLGRMQEHDRRHIERLLVHEPDRVGAVMEAVTVALPRGITVGEGIKRLQHHQPESPCGLFVVDDEHRLLGTLPATALLKASHNLPLHSLLGSPPVVLPAGMRLASALHHVGWETHRCLPVVERDNTLVGVLEYRTLLSLTAGGHGIASRPDAVSSILNLASLYWIAMAEILNTILGGRGNES